MAMGGSWTDAQVRQYGSIFDLVIVGQSASAQRVDDFRRVRPSIKVLAYTSAFDVHDEDPLFKDMQTRHPQWLLRNADGEPIHTYRDQHRWALDPGQPDLRDYFANAAKKRVEKLHADGVFEDNAMPDWNFKNFARGARALQGYPDPAAWRKAVDGWLALLEQRIAPAVVGANQVRPWTSHGKLVIIEELPTSGDAWSDMIEGLQRVSREGRVPVVLHTLDGPEDPARPFVAASLLLAAEPGAYLGFRWDGPRENARDLPEYHLDLGAPTGEAKRAASGVWKRPFQRALILVNPTDHPVEVAATQEARPSSMPPRSAAILWHDGIAAATPPGWLGRDRSR
jgi:hypothetical protein